MKNDEFVCITDYIEDIIVKLRYATEDNFTNKKIYDFNKAYLRYGTVQKLKKVQALLKDKGYGLMIWDAFRPVKSQFVLWEVCPNSTYVADPIHGFSDHSRGNTIDVTIIDQNGDELIMPTEFDNFTKLADLDYSDIEEEQKIENSTLLQTVMKAAGFKPYFDEWWHFTDSDDYDVETEFYPERNN